MKGTILGLFLYVAFVLQTVGLQYTTPSKNAFLTAVNVVIVPFIGFLLYKRKIDLFELSGAVIALIGVAVLSLKLSAEVNIGDLLTLCCAVGFAFHIFYTAKFVKDEDAVLLTIVQMAVAAVISWIVVIFKGETSFSFGIGRVTATALPRDFLDNDCLFITNSGSEVHYRNKSSNHSIDRSLLGYGLFSRDFK